MLNTFLYLKESLWMLLITRLYAKLIAKSLEALWNSLQVNCLFLHRSMKQMLAKFIRGLLLKRKIKFIPFSSELFTLVIRSAVTLLSKVLGLDNDSQVTAIMVGLFLFLYSSGTTPVHFNEFFSKEICSQLAKFHKVFNFRYQVYLYTLIIHTNRESFIKIDPYLFRNWPPTIPCIHTWPYSQFIDRFILSIFRVFSPYVRRTSDDDMRIAKILKMLDDLMWICLFVDVEEYDEDLMLLKSLCCWRPNDDEDLTMMMYKEYPPC